MFPHKRGTRHPGRFARGSTWPSHSSLGRGDSSSQPVLEDQRWGHSLPTPPSAGGNPFLAAHIQGCSFASGCGPCGSSGWHLCLLGMAMQPGRGCWERDTPLRWVLALLFHCNHFWDTGWRLQQKEDPCFSRQWFSLDGPLSRQGRGFLRLVHPQSRPFGAEASCSLWQRGGQAANLFSAFSPLEVAMHYLF